MELMFDYIIKNGFVVDGSGFPGRKGDLAIDNGYIVLLADEIEVALGQEVIDAKGLIVAPGFIDIHSHSDRSLPQNPKAESSVRQGVTTVVGGQCGGSAAPANDTVKEMIRRRLGFDVPWHTMADYMSFCEKLGIGINLAMLVGQGTVRGYVMGQDDRKPTEEELMTMCQLVEDAMKDGAYGMSTGRRYMPGCLASEAEVIELCKVVSTYNGIYMSHIYNQDEDILASIEDLITAGREARVAVQLVHQKVCGKTNWGNAGATLRLMEKARAEGVDILSDIYPYRYTQISSIDRMLGQVFPEKPPTEKARYLKDPQTQQKALKILEKMVKQDPDRLKSIQQTGVVWCKHTKNLEGLSYAQIAQEYQRDFLPALLQLFIDNEGQVKTAGIMCEEDIRSIIAHPYTMIGSDGFSIDGFPAEAGTLHPRNFGTYPYVLQHYVREYKLLHLEEAIYKMTGMPARRMGFTDRGYLQQGLAADVVVFDLNTVSDNATINEPRQYPSGIEYVWVNGRLTLEKGDYYPCFSGKILRKL